MTRGLRRPGTPLPPLCVIIDAQTAAARNWPVPELAAACVAGGARWLQVRGGDTPTGTLLGWCDEIVRLAARAGATVVVNDRIDVARLSGAAGVHLGQHDLPVEVARRQLGPRAVVGLSTHTPEQRDLAWSQPLTYLAVGPVHATATKATGYEPLGLDAVRAAASRGPALPVVAIGGITLDRAPDVIDAGAASVAVIGDLFAGDDPQARVRAYVEALGGAPK